MELHNYSNYYYSVLCGLARNGSAVGCMQVCDLSKTAHESSTRSPTRFAT